MYQFAQRRKYYFLFSSLVIISGLVAMVYSTAKYNSPVRLSIDFVGGTLMDVSFVENFDEQEVRDALATFGLENTVVQRLDPIKTTEIEAVDTPAGSRFEITIHEGIVLDELKKYMQDAEQLGLFWTSKSEEDDPLRESALDLSTTADGSTVMDVSFMDAHTEEDVTATLEGFGLTQFETRSLQPIPIQAGSRWQIRMKETGTEELDRLKAYMSENLGPFWTLEPSNPQSEITSSSVSATVGKEVTRAAFLATLAVAVIVLGFIVLAFRKVPHSFRYGACAIIAMFHDLLVTMGVMSILGIALGWEVDALFLTAILTVVGYSVQDSIVVFDRIRENIPKYRGEDYEMVVNRSVLETIHRSLATQLNAIFIMVAILLFGGETIKQFIAIMLIGLMSGTYSSIFNAVPLLIAWEKGEIPFVNREAKRARKEGAAAAS